MRNVTKSELFVELNNANRRAMQAERKLAAVEELAAHWRDNPILNEASIELRNILNGTCDS